MKKIGSEVKYSNDTFSIKIGTIDKKNPRTIYGVLGTYICPNIDKESYEDDINEFSKKSKENFNKLVNFSHYCEVNRQHLRNENRIFFFHLLGEEKSACFVVFKFCHCHISPLPFFARSF